ncbi:recombination mediator RecR [Hugenholtzia roseola]|uniref:recombination mediator RecR n=1 Tax=Hugenholtzia roseola TaxID=1002 RepID=UPI000406CF67|nr:recombination mediator RecR [Hugenholtzia roseola]
MNYPSKLIETAVNEISRLPSIGRKSALRLALHLLKQDPMEVRRLTQAIEDLVEKTQYCTQCHAISDTPICQVCSSPKRDRSVICVVESISDLMAIENTAQYNGLYHILGGVISPIEGVDAADLNIQSLVERAAQPETQEIILALNASMEGETTAFYLTKLLKEKQVRISTIARGVPIGGELEYTDEITLARSIAKRIRYE